MRACSRQKNATTKDTSVNRRVHLWSDIQREVDSARVPSKADKPMGLGASTLLYQD